LEKQAKKQQEFIKKTKEFIDKNIAGQKTKQAKSRQKQLEKLKKINLFEEEKNIKLKINAEKRSGNDVFILEDVSFSYSHKKIFEKINVGIYYKDRIAILGKNGSGKTTFLKLLNGELLPKSGIIKRGSGITIGYYDQMHIKLNDTLTVFETIKELAFLETKGYVYSYLARFGFIGEDTEKKVSALSGGEKSRLYLAKLIHNKPNVLILDEPTNHLDIPMIQSLENALLDYEGTIIFVSHDVTFIKNVSNRIFLLENYNLWEKFDEPDIVLKSLFVKSEIKKKTRNIANKQRKKRINPILLEKKQKQIEEKNKLLDECKNKLTEYQNKFSDAVFMKNPDNVKNLNKLIDETNNKIADLEEKLDELETEYLLMLEEE
jgi:ATP-binding cassette subfamily F protein 3